MLVGGFPCQPFSHAGKRGGFADTRGTLFFELCRILQSKRPRHFIFENVEGLLTHDNGGTIKTIVAALQELGYCVEWQLLDSRNHGVPQSRPRLYFVGYFGRKPERTVFPFASEEEELYEKRNIRIVGNISRNGRERGAVYSSDGIVGCLMASDCKQPKSVMIGSDVRYLTPMEYERLQGFPDGWTLVKKSGGGATSERTRYSTCGNAVTVNVVRDILKRLRENGEL